SPAGGWASLGKNGPRAASHAQGPRSGYAVPRDGGVMQVTHHWRDCRTCVSAASHEAAMKKGAREVKPGTVIYRQGGKLYVRKRLLTKRLRSTSKVITTLITETGFVFRGRAEGQLALALFL